jgi:hypothetical protein
MSDMKKKAPEKKMAKGGMVKIRVRREGLRQRRYGQGHLQGDGRGHPRRQVQGLLSGDLRHHGIQSQPERDH